jgi:hypothetical protein
MTITTSSATTVTVTKKITVSDLAKGDTVRVAGATANGTVTATSIRSGDLAGGFGGSRGGGFGGPPDGGGTGTDGSGGTPPTAGA